MRAIPTSGWPLALLVVLPVVLAVVLAGCSDGGSEPAGETPSPRTGGVDFIDGMVVSGNGAPEAGVWVIAETTALPTRYRKIVVTGADGRFLIPQLPDAEYQVWVRGYGLQDSEQVSAARGDSLILEVAPAADPQQAAMIYPANYWLSLLEPPGRSPGWSNGFKLGCQLCHQMGSVATRFQDRGLYDRGLKKASYMHATADGLGREALLDALEDWSARIGAGEVPVAPPRPRGSERNLVITQWDWGDGFTHAYGVATDRRDPARYPHRPIHGVDPGNDQLLALDPMTHAATETAVPTRDGYATPRCEATYKPPDGDVAPSGFGSLGCPVEPGLTLFEGVYRNPANPHHPVLDDRGRVWIATQIRRQWAEDLPEFCRSAPRIADDFRHRQLGWYDTGTGDFELIDTCYGTHHLQFDADGVLWTSGDARVIGWFDPARYDPADPASLEQAQGWSAVIIDSDGDGSADTPITGPGYGVMPNPRDRSIWTAQPGGEPGGDPDDRGRLVRYDPATDTHETFVPPLPGYGPRGVDVDSNGLLWVALGGSGHLARFDRTKCAQTWGTGDQCPEGWTLFRSPGPPMRVGDAAVELQSADFHYGLFVDRFNTLGLGDDVVVVNGTGSDSLLAFDQATREFTVIRIPYPLNTFTRGLDGRIDDADAGWKGRGLWFTNGLDPIMHSESPHSYVGKVQLRPDPLAH